MASNSRVSILDYFNIVFEGENGKIESNCKACGTRIQAKRSVTSNFVTHLKVRAGETGDAILYDSHRYITATARDPRPECRLTHVIFCIFLGIEICESAADMLTT